MGVEGGHGNSPFSDASARLATVVQPGTKTGDDDIRELGLAGPGELRL